MIGPRSEPTDRRKPLGGRQQLLNFLICVQIRMGASRSKRKQSTRWNLGAWIGRAPVAREHANETESYGPIAWLMVLGLHRPLQRQCRRDMRFGFLLQERHEIGQPGGHIAQLES